MYLTVHDGCRAWKSFDWESTDRLYRQGLIEDPVNKTKSVVLTTRGLEEAERLFKQLFTKR
jgi:Mn-dependent DtxR family transcriptional regulator